MNLLLLTGVFLLASAAHGTSCVASGVGDSINKCVLYTQNLASVAALTQYCFRVKRYSTFATFGSVVVKCPIEVTWSTVGNAKTWFQAVIGKRLINITLVEGDGRQLQSKLNYFVASVISNAPAGRTQQRVISLSDYDYELVTTFDSSTLPLFPWTTVVRLERVTFLEHRVNYTLINFAQQGNINVPEERRPVIRDQVQSLFYNVFAPSLKEAFDGCAESETP
ncbi:hypothetical protein FGB62_1g012 [Gracilaria domingensis]|nr:hypothetical protein FGB62_1g012 [Gracilaria domingensis]